MVMDVRNSNKSYSDQINFMLQHTYSVIIPVAKRENKKVIEPTIYQT
jgi:hypothetical protein